MKVFALEMRFYESRFIFLVNAKADPFFSTTNGKPLYRKRKTTCLPKKTLSTFLYARTSLLDISFAKGNFHLASEALLFGSRPSSGLILRTVFLARLTSSSVGETA